MELFDATPDYVRFRDGRLSTEYRYPRRIAGDTSIRLADGPTWAASFTGSGSGSFYVESHISLYSAGTISFTWSSFAGQTVTFTGSGTNWTSALVGQVLQEWSGANAIYIITAVSSPTSLTAKNPSFGSFLGSYSGEPYVIGPVWAWVGNARAPEASVVNDFDSVEK